MSLREVATTDLNYITTNDFAMDITLTDPSQVSGSVKGFTNDIGQVIDPDTGQIVSGRIATVAISIRSLTAVNLGFPEGVEDASGKPWIVQFNDVDLNSYLFKVLGSHPDRALGIVTCELEFYKNAA